MPTHRRNAGPEDMVATEALLQRLLANEGSYSPGFIAEYKIFVRELRAFFNAPDLDDLLASTFPSLTEQHQADCRMFLQARAQAAALPPQPSLASLDRLFEALMWATTARGGYVAALASGLRNDAPDSALEMRQRHRLAELRCEETAFLLLSRIANCLEGLGGAGALAASPKDNRWKLALDSIKMAARQCKMKGGREQCDQRGEAGCRPPFPLLSAAVLCLPPPCFCAYTTYPHVPHAWEHTIYAYKHLSIPAVPASLPPDTVRTPARRRSELP